VLEFERSVAKLTRAGTVPTGVLQGLQLAFQRKIRRHALFSGECDYLGSAGQLSIFLSPTKPSADDELHDEVIAGVTWVEAHAEI